MGSRRLPGYSALLVFTILMVLGAALTLLPFPLAYRTSMLGYKSLCTLAPISTLACLGMAWLGFRNLRTRLLEP